MLDLVRMTFLFYVGNTPYFSSMFVLLYMFLSKRSIVHLPYYHISYQFQFTTVFYDRQCYAKDVFKSLCSYHRMRTIHTELLCKLLYTIIITFVILAFAHTIECCFLCIILIHNLLLLLMCIKYIYNSSTINYRGSNK